MTQPTFACLLAEDAVTILCLRQGGWQVEPIGGEASTPLANERVVPEVLAQLSERLNLPGGLTHVRLFLVYADGVASRLPAALSGMAALGGTPLELLRRDRLGPDARHGAPSTIMDRLFPVASRTPGASMSTSPAPSPPPAAARPAIPNNAAAALSGTRFYTVDAGPGQSALVYDSRSGLLWPSAAATDGPLALTDAAHVATGLLFAGMSHWRVPQQHELEEFARADQPLRDRRRATMLERWNWLCAEGRLDLVKGTLTPGAGGHLLPVLDLARGRTFAEFVALAQARGWQVAPWSA
jgi:hypothetical protein